MCLNPVKIVNPRKEISLAGGQPFYLEVPCGHCAECIKSQRNEWYFRTYYEAMDTFDNNGYVLFDTLTYSPEKLPHLSEFINIPEDMDMPCFDKEDYRNFICQLRMEWTRLANKGYAKKPTKDNFKYFLTSEYGSKGHRPHYHVLFFVKDDAIRWDLLSKLINKCWHRGRTDGYPSQSLLYVRDKRVFSRKQCADVNYLMNCCRYVSKYISKSNDFERKLDEKLEYLFKQKYGDEWRSEDGDEYLKDKFNEMRRHLDQFHRQSNGFGISFLNYNNYDDIMKTGMIRIPSQDLKVVKEIPLPMYYQLKIFYDLHKDASGHAVSWKLNEEGKKFKFIRSMNAVDNLKIKIEDWIKNMQNKDYYYEGNNGDSWYSQVDRFLQYNAGRDLHFFAMYLLLYKGRIKSEAQLKREENGIYKVDDPIEFYTAPWDELKNYEAKKFYNYGTKTSRRCLGSKFITSKYLGEIRKDRDEYDYMDSHLIPWMHHVSICRTHEGYSPSIFNSKLNLGELYTYDYFGSHYVINETADERFKDYDRMFDIYCRCQIPKGVFKQRAFDSKEEAKDKLKEVFNKNII